MSSLPKIKEYFSYQDEFTEEHISKEQKNIVNEIDKILDTLNFGDKLNKEIDGINSWDANKLISAESKLVHYSNDLEPFIEQHQSLCDFAYIWRKGAYADDWLPIKTKLKKENEDRITNAEVENELTSKYIGEQFFSMFHRRRADYLIRKVDSIDKMIRVIGHRLRELNRSFNLSNK